MNTKAAQNAIRNRASVFLAALFLAHGACADPLDQWTKRSSGVSVTLAVVTYANYQFVAVGLGGTILTSPDGVTWTKRTSGTSGDIYSVAYGGSQWVAVGPGGLVLTSPDATTWTLRNSGTTTDLYYVTFGNGRFVVVGNTLLSSTDGVHWTPNAALSLGVLSNPTFDGITFANGKFVAVGQAEWWNLFGYTIVGTSSTSSDGVNWTPLSNLGSSGLAYFGLVNVRWGNNTFVASGSSGQVFTSPDAINWTLRSSPTANSLNGLTFGEGVFVVAGQAGTILTSSDGQTWIVRNSGTGSDLYEVVHGSDSFVAVGASGTVLQSGTFTHAAAPTVTTQPASDLNWMGATLSGTANPNGATTTAWFEYGLTTSYGSNTTATNIGSGTNEVSLTMPLDGLLAATNYHFRLVATNSVGTTSSSDSLFLTLPGPGLSIASQGTNVALWWPQAASNYTLEATAGLNPANWTPVGTNAQPLDGKYQVTFPTGPDNQFYRLRQP